jgi:hypothetical protein
MSVSPLGRACGASREPGGLSGPGGHGGAPGTSILGTSHWPDPVSASHTAYGFVTRTGEPWRKRSRHHDRKEPAQCVTVGGPGTGRVRQEMAE